MLSKKPSLPKPPAPTTSIKSPMKMGSTAVKMPKQKKLPGAFDKPSVFFKSEDSGGPKHPSVRKLKAFLETVKGKRQSLK